MWKRLPRKRTESQGGGGADDDHPMPAHSADRAIQGPIRHFFSDGSPDTDGGGSHGFHVAIIGAGLSGSLLAVHLLRGCRPQDRVYLIEGRAGFGRGLAYSTSNPNHRLNVRAGNMSAFHDQPDHFVDWLRHRAAASGDPPPNADSFVSRQLYGTYIRSLLTEELWRGGKGRNLVLVPDTAHTIRPLPGGSGDPLHGRLAVTIGMGRTYPVDAAVVAAGHLPPDRSAGAYVGNPWDPEAITGLAADAAVVLIGTGLTMIDTVQSLLDAGHRGPILAVSRRGLLPQPHRPTTGHRLPAEALPPTTSVARLCRWLRREAERAEADGVGWRAVIDGIRPHLPDIWRRLPIDERRRFLRHLRPWWEVRRHRLAPEIAAMLDAAVRRGQLSVRAARVLAIDAGPDRVRLRLRDRVGGREAWIEAARVINCSGPESDYRAARHPLLRDLLDTGLARPDPLNLGLDVTEESALIDADGRLWGTLFALGPVTRGTFWEVSAVPDIRLHAVRLASRLLRLREARLAQARPVRRR
jgi:uncharacterized NAD(P)/FAD-binding protein YdhS